MGQIRGVTPSIWHYKKGVVSGDTLIDFRGDSNTISSTPQTVWGESSIYTFPTVGTQVTISSSSANDTSSGTGLQAVLLGYLDSNYEEQQELIALNGQTAANSVSTDIFRINTTIGVTAGTNKVNDGIVYVGTGAVTAGKPANVLSHMKIGAGFAHNGVYTVPVGKSISDIGFTFSVSSNKQIKADFSTFNVLGTGTKNIFFTVKDLEKFGNINLAGQSAVPEKTDLIINACVASGTAEFSFIYSFLQFD